jgi:hypothetical protein
MSDRFNQKSGAYNAQIPVQLVRRPANRGDRDKKVHAAFGLLGFVAAMVGAFVAYDRTSSIALPIFVFFMTQFFVGRGLGDVVTDPHKVQRFVYFLLLPVLSSGIVWLSYQWWDLMWLSVILGLLIGPMVWTIVAMVAFSSIHLSEMKDTEERQKERGI